VAINFWLVLFCEKLKSVEDMNIGIYCIYIPMFMVEDEENGPKELRSSLENQDQIGS